MLVTMSSNVHADSSSLEFQSGARESACKRKHAQFAMSPAESMTAVLDLQLTPDAIMALVMVLSDTQA
jgi:hypothetical protein